MAGTYVDTGELNFGNYGSQLTGVPVIGALDPNTSASVTPSLLTTQQATTPPPYRVGADTPVTAPTNIFGVQTNLTTQTEVTPSTPYATPTTPSSTPDLNQDSYRYGGFKNTALTADNLQYSRVLGEEDDNIASLSLSTQVGPDNQQVRVQTLQALGQSSLGGNIVSAYTRFMLQDIAEGEQEKMQVVETFTAFYAFFYGKKPPIYRYSGILLNDENHKWTNDFKFFYQNYFRGTRAAELGAQAVLSYDGRIVTGFIVDMQIGQTSVINKGASFSFNMLVTDHTPSYYSADINALIQTLTQQLAAQAALIQQQMAGINSNVPGAQSIAASQVRNNQLAPTSAQPTGTNNGVQQAFSLLSAGSKLFA